MSLQKVLTSFPNPITTWRQAGIKTWNGRAYTLLTLTHATLALYVIYRVALYTFKSPKPPRLTKSSPPTEPIGNQRPLDHYRTWCESLPSPLASLQGGRWTVNLEFKSNVPSMKGFESELSATLLEGRISVENCEQPKDIQTLKDQMKQSGWSEKEIEFLLPLLSGPKAWLQLANDAYPAIMNNKRPKKTEPNTTLSELPQYSNYGFCFIGKRKNGIPLVYLSARYYTTNKEFIIPIGFRINFSERSPLFLTEFCF